MPTIAVDAMGGDHAPDEVVKGVAQVSLATDIECLLVGDERRIQSVLEGVSYNPEHIAILHAPDAIGMAEEPRQAVKRRDASLVVGEAHRRLRQLPVVNFVGNVEGNDLVRGRADVIVCEGLLGNVALKLIEGLSEVLYDVTGRAGERRVAWRLGLRLLSRGSARARALTDYTQYGGSPVLGFEHLLIKCRGRSGARAIANAVKVAAKAVRDHVPREIADALAAAR